MPSTGHYPIERREGEIERLRMQAAAIEFDASVMLDRIGVGAGWRCLDLGCGPGGIIELLSLRAGPTGRVVSLDADLVFLERARVLARDRGLGNVDFVQGDAYCTGLARGSFELVHARFEQRHVIRIDFEAHLNDRVAQVMLVLLVGASARRQLDSDFRKGLRRGRRLTPAMSDYEQARDEKARFAGGTSFHERRA